MLFEVSPVSRWRTSLCCGRYKLNNTPEYVLMEVPKKACWLTGAACRHLPRGPTCCTVAKTSWLLLLLRCWRREENAPFRVCIFMSKLTYSSSLFRQKPEIPASCVCVLDTLLSIVRVVRRQRADHAEAGCYTRCRQSTCTHIMLLRAVVLGCVRALGVGCLAGAR